MGKQIKKKNYEQLFQRITDALSKKYYFEVSWIAYSILEDRLVSLLNQTGGSVYSNGDQIKMLGPKMVELSKRMKSDKLLWAALYGEIDITTKQPTEGIMPELYEWKKERNDLMHTLADTEVPIEELQKRIYLLATKGQKLAKKVSTSAQRLKKWKTK